MKISNKYINTMYDKFARMLGVILLAAMMTTTMVAGIAPLNLLSLSNFVILAGSTVTGVPPVTITGNVGLSPAAGSYITGFDGSNVVGTLYVVDASGPSGSVINSTLLQTAKSDLTTAYTEAANRTPVPTGAFLNPGGSNIGGLNLAPGLYKFTGAANITGADVTLTGNATDVWIFQIGSSLNLGSGIKIILAGGAQASNIFWQVGTSATLGTYSVFKGTILADQSISFGTGASMDGRALAFSAAVTMASGVTTVRATSTASPIFSANHYQVTYGNVANFTSKIDTVIVTNTGGADLVITNVTSSNSVFSVNTTSGTITPGGTKQFMITYSPLSNGYQTSNIIFSHNAAKPRDTIAVNGNGNSPIATVTPSTINFGSVVSGLNKKDSVTVSNSGSANLVVTSITSSNSYFAVTPATGTIAPGASMKFYILYSPLTDGAQAGKLIFNHNAIKPKDTVSVSGNGLAPKFLANVSSVNFGNVRKGIQKTDSVIISNTGTSNLLITSVTSSNVVFAVTPTNATIIPGGTLKYYFTYAPLADGLLTGSIVFTHNAANPKDTITVSGTGISSKFAVTPMEVNFGDVVNGTTKTETVTVTNSGTADLIISSFVSTNTTFTLTALNATIAPGASRIFNVTFTPLVSGIQDGWIRFNVNSTTTKDSIHVTGTGIGNPVFASFSVNPLSLVFGSVVSGTTKKDSIVVTNSGTANLIILSAKSSNKFYTIDLGTGVVEAGTSRKFYVNFSPLSMSVQNGYIAFHHNATNPRDTLYLAGNSSGSDLSPKFTVNRSNLDFGNVRVKTTKQLSVYVTNTGVSDLIISDIASSSPFYSITPIIGTIVPNASQEFFITFAPQVQGKVSANIDFDHNVGNSIITVTGTGIDTIGVNTIRAARDLPIGTLVIVEGVVTRTMGDYTRIQDATGGLTLFQVSGQFHSNVQNAEIAMGDKVRIEGRISEHDFLKVINTTDLVGFLRLSRANPLPASAVLSLVQVALTGEQYESCMIRVNNLTVDSDSDVVFQTPKIYQNTDISDKTNTVVIRIGKNTNTRMGGMPFYSKLATFEGVLGQATANLVCGYQLTPVLSTDLRFSPLGVMSPIAGNQSSLSDNYPNPFSTSTTIQYSIDKPDVVTLKVFTMLGREVATLVSEMQDAGNHTATFTRDDASNLGSEMYMYRLEVGTLVTAKQMILVK
ncbi:MAG: choice-of-anchor D domain-containing protein [Ignavibacteria bacterium]|nr:choice-of-anchor D domain-containing protein [Ignavibacteria bacterium]